MTSRRYSAIEVQQRPGVAPFYLLSCQASDLLQWADAPRKRAEVRAGYQRDLEARRVSRIAKFLELDTKNILPSAVLVAVRAGSYSIAKEASGLSSITIELPDMDPATCRVAMESDLFGRLSDEERTIASNLAQAEAQADEEVEAENNDGDSDATPPPSYFAALAAEIAGYDSLSAERRAQIDDFVVSYAKPGLILDGQHRVFGAKEYEDVGRLIQNSV